VIAAVLCASLLAHAPNHAAGSASKPSGVLVVPLDTPANDGRTYWLGEAVSILIAEDIDARGLGAISRQSRERAYDQLHLPPNAVLSRATVIKVGEIVGAERVLVGEVSVDGDSLSITVQPVRLDIGRADPPVTERGDLQNLFDLARKVARRAVPGGGEPALAPSPTLQAFEQYVKGLLAEEPGARAAFLQKALDLQPSYDRARIALWDLRTSQGDYQAALAAVHGIQSDSPEARRGSFLASVSLVQLKQYDEAFKLLQSLDGTPPAPAVLNDLGVVQIRRGGSPETGKPVYFLTKAATAAPDDSDVLFNLGYAYALDRDPQGAIYWLRESLRRKPDDGDAHYVLAAALDMAGSTIEASRERELAAQLSAHWADSARRLAAPGARAESVPRGLERLREDLGARSDIVDRALANTAQRDQEQLAQFHLDRARRLFGAEQDTDALSELQQTVFLSPYDSDAHLLLGRIYLRDGRPRDAVNALKISIWSKDSAAARLALADAYLKLKDPASARTQALRALEVDPGSSEAKAMLERIDRGGLRSPPNRIRSEV
jgi:tetratricopeptide (TPR) repeat protein